MWFTILTAQIPFRQHPWTQATKTSVTSGVNWLEVNSLSCKKCGFRWKPIINLNNGILTHIFFILAATFNFRWTKNSKPQSYKREVKKEKWTNKSKPISLVNHLSYVSLFRAYQVPYCWKYQIISRVCGDGWSIKTYMLASTNAQLGSFWLGYDKLQWKLIRIPVIQLHGNLDDPEA